MSRMIAWAAIFALSFVALITPARPNEGKFTVIRGATVIDCTGRSPIKDGVVVLEDDKIIAVGSKRTVRVPRGARVIDASGKYVIPGLIDMHVHYREWQGELFVAHGITAVKDLGNPVEWISELSKMQADGRLRGPKILYVGNNLDASPPEGDHHIGISSERDAEKLVSLLSKFGVAAIKVRHKTRPETLRWLTRAAHARGLPVTGHLSATNAMEAATAGIDGLEHASGVAQAAAESPDQIDASAKGIRAFLDDLRGFTRMSEDREAALIKQLVEERVTLIPTLGVRRRAVQEDHRPAVIEDDRYASSQALAYVPQQVRKDWSDPVLDKMIRQSFSKEDIQTMREGYHRLERFVLRFRRAGGVVVAGSDNLNGVAGLTFHREIESLVLAGLTPMEALLAATRDAAMLLKRDDLGTIEAGKAADVLILGANPLDEIRNLRKIEKVFQNGRELDFGFHADYALPPPRPELVRPLFLERLLAKEN